MAKNLTSVKTLTSESTLYMLVSVSIVYLVLSNLLQSIFKLVTDFMLLTAYNDFYNEFFNIFFLLGFRGSDEVSVQRSNSRYLCVAVLSIPGLFALFWTTLAFDLV